MIRSTFEGTYVERSLANVFVLNSQGNSFVRTAKATVKPFHAWFASEGTAAQASLAIGDFSQADAVILPFNTDNEVVDVYSINGIKVTTARVTDGHIDLTNIPKGIYVVNGKKIVVK